jgi:muramoyltetrapeptide carboxypeptidase
MVQKLSIGIVAPSAKVPKIELKLGLEKLRAEGFAVDVHPQCAKSHLFFAGTDEQRAQGFFDFAQSSKYSVIWCARGGHGAIRVLPILERMALEQGLPGKKLLIGYSDSTALMEYVRCEWGWSILHAPMPSMRTFSILDEQDWAALKSWIQGDIIAPPWALTPLSFWTPAPKSSLVAPLIGGNLTVWNCLLGTRFQGRADGCMLFLEDVHEPLYRIDRMLQQLLISGSLNNVRAIVLGNFMDCKDSVPSVLKSAPTAKNKMRMLTAAKPSELQPLRKPMAEKKLLKELFSELGAHLQIPVLYGLPVGHGPEISPLPLGAMYRLTPQARLELVSWSWLIS